MGALAVAVGACAGPSQEAGPIRSSPTAESPSASETEAAPGAFDLFTPRGRASGKQLHYFEDVPSMTATADLVVRGRVTDVALGEPEYDPGDPSGKPVLTARVVTLEVTGVYRSGGEAPATVRLYEGHFNRDGAGIQYGNVTWTKKGATGIYFLTLNAHTGIYLLVSSQGRVLLDSAGPASSADDRDPLHKRIEQMTEPELDEAIAKAAKAAKDGKIKPQKPL
ncbi:hypothetical protein [Actinocorallia aurantiaca]|uniref:hypothetical protein n=1 Tax=Actinocorallia aurantiaca TaxID=46204 RepID=UPI0031CE4D9F